MAIKKGNIGNALHSVAPDHVVVTTDEVFDETQNKYQDEINYGIGEDISDIESDISSIEANIGYYECSTGASTAAKTVSASGYSLVVGGAIKVKFINTNTASDNVTLNINGVGAKPLYYNGNLVDANHKWRAGEVVDIYYDGTNYQANSVDGGSGDGVYDISAEHLTEGNPTQYTSLADALGTNGANIPANKRKGGMSIKYIDSTTGKYVQYRYTSSSVTNADLVNIGNWQGVDAEPTAGSHNLVESGGVFPTINAVNKSLIPINGKVSIIGDSISTFNGTMPSGYITYYPYQSLGVISLYDMWWHLLLSMTNSKLEVNASWSGSRATNGRAGEGYPDFYDRTNILGSPDYIFVELGTNDSSSSVALGDYDYDSEDLSESEFIPAYIKGVKALKTNYPNAKIVLFVFQMKDSYASAIKNIGNYYELDVIDVRSYYINNVHPNKLQMCSVAQTISSSYIKGDVDKLLAEGAVYDISANHLTEGNPTKYATLLEALGTNGANIPTAKRKGGMSIKYIQTSDNKYVQYFLTKDEWSANEGDWEKMNLEEEVSQLSYLLKPTMGTPEITWSDGYYTAATLAVGGGSNYKHSTPIQMKAGDALYYYSGNSYGSIAMMVETDSEGKGLKLIQAGTSTAPRTFEYLFIAKKDLYVALSSYASNVATNIVKLIQSDTIQDIYKNIISNNDAIYGLDKNVHGYKLSDYVWNDKKAINPNTGELQTNVDTIGCDVYFPVPVGATYVRFLDTDTIDTNVVWYNLGFYGSNYSIISRSSYAATTKWELPSGTAFIRVVLALRNSEGQSIGGLQEDYNLDAISMFFSDTTKEELVDLKDNVAESTAGIEGLINTAVRFNQNELSLGKSLNLSIMRWIDGKGLDINGLINNPKCIACPDIIDVRGFSSVVLEDLNTEDGNVLYYAITQLNDNKVGLNRLGYRTNGTFALSGDTAYIYVSLGLHNGSSDIGGHQADYDLSNAQITLAKEGADDVRYEYDGERINVANSLKWELVAKSTHAAALQGGAAYGDYYFQFHGQNNKNGSGQPVLFYGVEVFNLKTRRKIQEILLGFDILKHNNAVTFSDVYYDANDPLPLIYASQEDVNARYCTVYRILDTGMEETPFSLMMVQVIKLPPVAEANYYYPNCYVDGNKLIYGGFSNADTAKYIYEVYPLPAISDGETLNIGTIQISDDGYGEPGTAQGYTLSDGSVVKANDNDSGTTIKAVYLDHAEVISTSFIDKINPYTGNNATTQGGVAKDGMLYVTFGSANNAVLKAVNVETGQVRSTINLVALGLNHEPETAFIYNYQLGVGFNSSGQIVVFNFD